MRFTSMKTRAAILAAVLLSGCSDPAGSPQASAEAQQPAPGTLAWALTGAWRLDPERDRWRHPAETLAFFGLEPGMTVVEIYPGRGWYTDILAPYLARTNGKLYAATFEAASADADAAATRAALAERLAANPELYGAVTLTALGPEALEIAPEGAADLVLSFRNVHTFMAGGFAEDAFASFYRALKPGGVLGVVQHRARSTGLQDPQAADGYVQEEYVKALAREAGFVFEAASDINANPNDTKDHPFGVWTLPPILATAPVGAAADPSFSSAPYLAIGESDRMTLKFRKPPAAAPAP